MFYGQVEALAEDFADGDVVEKGDVVRRAAEALLVPLNGSPIVVREKGPHTQKEQRFEMVGINAAGFFELGIGLSVAFDVEQFDCSWRPACRLRP